MGFRSLKVTIIHLLVSALSNGRLESVVILTVFDTAIILVTVLVLHLWKRRYFADVYEVHRIQSRSNGIMISQSNFVHNRYYLLYLIKKCFYFLFN